MKYFLFPSLLFSFCLFPSFSFAQVSTSTSSASTSSIITEQAEVTAVLNQSNEQIAGTTVTAVDQSINIKIISGQDEGKTAIIDNDKFLSNVGDIIYVKHTIDSGKRSRFILGIQILIVCRCSHSLSGFSFYAPWRLAAAGSTWPHSARAWAFGNRLYPLAGNFPWIFSDSLEHACRFAYCHSRLLHDSWLEQSDDSRCHRHDSDDTFDERACLHGYSFR